MCRTSSDTTSAPSRPRQRSNIINASLFLLIILGWHRFGAAAHKCYVCGKNGKSCDSFTEDNRYQFEEECDASIKTCKTERPVSGKVLERFCGEPNLILDDCNTANGIEYCYCPKNLCNGIRVRFSDDEDLDMESSGSYPSSTVPTTSKTTPKPLVTKASSSTKKLNCGILLFLTLFALI